MGATLSPDASRLFQTYQQNLLWAKTHDRELDKFEDKFVAIDDGKVVASDTSQKAVAERVRGHPAAYIMFVVRRGMIWSLHRQIDG